MASAPCPNAAFAAAKPSQRSRKGTSPHRFGPGPAMKDAPEDVRAPGTPRFLPLALRSPPSVHPQLNRSVKDNRSWLIRRCGVSG